MTLPLAVPGQEVLSGPERRGNQRVWSVRLPDGRRAVLEQLVPELARDEAVRRRYVRDAERLRALAVPRLAEVIAVGEDWRLRRDVDGRSLDEDLRARAPLPVDEAIALTAELADLLHDVHRKGAVLRDLQPRQIVRAHDGLWLVDVGLARVDILSTRTASSVILEGSPYASPEHLAAPHVDARSDLYSLGVIAWRALTGSLPFGDTPAILRKRTPLPPLGSLRQEIPPGLDAILQALLSEDPADRPASAREVAAALRGEGDVPRAIVRRRCQACGAALPAGLRLCVECGRQAIQFSRHRDGELPSALVITSIKEDAATLTQLREILQVTSEGPVPSLNFLIGDQRMYAKEERKSLLRLPLVLYGDLDAASATALQTRVNAIGGSLKTKVTRRFGPRLVRMGKVATFAGLAAMVGGIFGLAANMLPFLVLMLPGMIAVIFGIIAWARGKMPGQVPLLALRESPAMLPAGDPLVARLAKLLSQDTSPDIRRQVTELAVLVQRLADRRAQASALTAAEIDLVIAPVEELCGLIETEVAALTTLDRELADLDEGAMVRALATSEARKEVPARRDTILAGLDRLRSLEDERARRMERLLEAGSLLRRAVDLALRAEDPDAQMERDLRAAMAALEET